MENYRDAETIRSHVEQGRVFLIENTIIGSGYRVAECLGEYSWGNSYKAEKNNNYYLIKIYANACKYRHVSQRIKNIKSNYLLPILDNGEFGDYFYEVFPFVEYKTLKGRRITDLEILTLIINSVNEGLGELHKNGITHGDIKPSNIFFDEHTGVVCIFDYEAATLKEEGYIVNNVQGTMEYSSPSSHAFSRAVRPIEYDYGSLGIMIMDIYMGYVHFSGYSESEIVREWNTGIAIPDEIPIRLKSLLKGLFQVDERRRLGYKGVSSWCLNKFVDYSCHIEGEKKKPEPFIFGYDGVTPIKVNDLKELAECLLKYKELAIKRYFKASNNLEKMFEFISSVDEKQGVEARQLVKNNSEDSEAAIFKLANLLDKSSLLVLNGKEYADFGDLVEDLPDEKIDVPFIEFVKSGALVYYLRNGGNNSVADTIEQTLKVPYIDDELLYFMIKYRFCNNAILMIGKDCISSIEDLCEHMALNGFTFIQKDSNYPRICAWLYMNGYSEGVRKMKEVINKYE